MSPAPKNNNFLCLHHQKVNLTHQTALFNIYFFYFPFFLPQYHSTQAKKFLWLQLATQNTIYSIISLSSVTSHLLNYLCPSPTVYSAPSKALVGTLDKMFTSRQQEPHQRFQPLTHGHKRYISTSTNTHKQAPVGRRGLKPRWWKALVPR